jgi:hypothetical protein
MRLPSAVTSVALRLLQRSSRGGLLLRRRGLSAASAAPASSITSVLEKYGLPPTAAAPSANAAAVERQLCFLKVLGVPNLASAVQRDPQLLERDPRASAPHIDYLLSLGIADIGPIVGRCPQVLSCDVNDDLHRKVAILRALGVRQTGRFVENCPRFAILDVEADMRPSIEYLRSIEGLDLGKVLNELPNAVFGAGRKARLEATVNYLVEECAVPRHRLAKMLARWPALLARDLEADLKPKVAWLKSVGLTSVEHVIERNPRVLGSSLPTLQAKHAFLTTVWKRSVSELEVFPQSLTYSLAYLRKRHGFLKLHGREGKGRLHRLLRTADVLFAKKLAGGRTAEEYQAFQPPEELAEDAAAAAAAAAAAVDAGDVDDGSATEAGVPSESAAGVALASARPLKSAQPEGLGGGIGAEMSAIDKFTRRHVEMARRDAEKVQAIERTRAAVQEFYAKPDGAAAAPARAAAAPPPPPMATAEGDAPTVAPAA